MKNTILVTGAAGFIGSHLVDRLLFEGYKVVGIDNFNDYYDPKIKEQNLENAKKSERFKLFRFDILDFSTLLKTFSEEKINKVVHLAARTGVRPSLKNPYLYTQVNVLGTVNLLKASVDNDVSQFIFGSSSSVYGNSEKIPFSEDDLCENIISPYGASKRAAEFFVESFGKNFGLKSTILRFFTVYGPRGRPDMAPALFTNAIINNEVVNKFGSGNTSRDYTFIDDIVDGILKTLKSDLNFEIINLGNNNPVPLNEFIATLESILGKAARVKKMPVQMGDVEKTWANVVKARRLLGWEPKVALSEGLEKYVKWLKNQKRDPLP